MKRFINNISKLQALKPKNNNLSYFSSSIIKTNNNNNNNNSSKLNIFSNNNNNTSLLNNNNNNNIKFRDQRFYCQKNNNNNNNSFRGISEDVTNAEIDHHGEDDTTGEFKANIVDGVRIEPKYYIEFTCTYVDPKLKTECGFVSKKTFSKHSYHKGVVLIKCDGCKKIHTIADNLGWTGYLDDAKNIEEIMAAKGEPVRKYLLKQDEINPDDETTGEKEPVLIGDSNSNTTSNNNTDSKK